MIDTLFSNEMTRKKKDDYALIFLSTYHQDKTTNNYKFLTFNENSKDLFNLK